MADVMVSPGPETSDDASMTTDGHTVTLPRLLDLVDPVDSDTLTLFRDLSMGVCLLISSMGIFTNFINLHTFFRMGLDDSVTIVFFALAISDFSNCTLAFAQSLGAGSELLEKEFELRYRVSPAVPIIFMEFTRKIFSSLTALITTYVAVQRCLCVLIPLQVRGVFTKLKTYCFLAAAASFFAICFGLILWRYGVKEIPSFVVSNATQLMFYVKPKSGPYFFVADVVIGVIINVACQVTVPVCLIVMAVSLKKSMDFKKKATNATSSATAAKDAMGGSSSSTTTTQENTTSVKEIQALKQVALISFIFFCTNCPYFGLGMARMIEPEFGLRLAYGNSFLLTVSIMFMTEQLNSAVNFFVYFNFNSKFRKTCILSPKN